MSNASAVHQQQGKCQLRTFNNATVLHPQQGTHQLSYAKQSWICLSCHINCLVDSLLLQAVCYACTAVTPDELRLPERLLLGCLLAM